MRSTFFARAARVIAAHALVAGCAGDAFDAPDPNQERATASLLATAAAPASTTVTLLTGDRVHVMSVGQGDSVAIEPGPGRAHIHFVQQRVARDGREEIHVIPSDAVPLLASGQLDRELFNITSLIRQGFDDANSNALPLIVRFRPGLGPTAAATALAADGTVRPLPSIDAAAIVEDRDRAGNLWRSLTAGAAGTAAAQAAPDSGIATVWLDGRAWPLLDESAPQVGAPQAWAAGLTGRDIAVAVLDTGVDVGHPDLRGKVTESVDFTDSATAGDEVGHGTHVASIIAGTGAASSGRYQGLAPDATLLNGKVCTKDGCAFSDIIAGMEWAAARARIVNMSLGGPPSDGPDPLSEALNALAAQHGTLFVVAAGNLGIRGGINTPGVADAALTVGSVTKQDSMSDFSSRGPRIGDRAVKPDMVAPGSAIVAARVVGTFAGDREPIDDHYCRLSGTSMAAPHVAAAAAILVQAHPDWSGAQIKAALMSTAAPIDDADVYEQGAGRLDVARAATQPVHASPGSLSFTLPRPQDGALVTKSVTYRNDSDAPVVLDLALAVTGSDGVPAPDGVFSLGSSRITVAAHDQGAVTVTGNRAAAPAGFYSGHLIATAGGSRIVVAVGGYVEPEGFDLTIQSLGRHGRPAVSSPAVVDLTTNEVVFPRFGSRHVVRLKKGTYAVINMIFTFDPDGKNGSTLVVAPEVELDADVTVVMDARRGRPVTVAVDEPSAVTTNTTLSLVVENALTTTLVSSGVLYAAPTGAVSDRFQFTSRFVLMPETPAPAEPFIYNLVFGAIGGIPGDLAYRVRDRELAQVHAHYRLAGPPGSAPAETRRFDISQLKGRDGTGEVIWRDVQLPSRWREYYTAADNVEWLSQLRIEVPGEGREATSVIRSFRPGHHVEEWNRAPIGPALNERQRSGLERIGDVLDVSISLFSPSEPGHVTLSRVRDLAGTTTLSRDGVVLGSVPTPGLGEFSVPPDRGRYTLRTAATRSVPWSLLATAVEASWTFESAPPAGAAAAQVPLMVVRATGLSDDSGTAPAGCLYPLLLRVERSTAPARVADLELDVSYDDGASWQRVPVLRIADFGLALLHHPDRSGFVSLRTRARDVHDETVDQTVVRAYAIAPRR